MVSQKTIITNQNVKFMRKVGLLLSFLIGFWSVSYGQTLQVTGTVTSKADGSTLPGVTVLEKGTQNGTVTDINGKYSLKVKQGAVVQFSFVGMKTTEVKADRGVINVELEPAVTELGELVVTALGIKREKKALGYAHQDVKGDALLQTRENNIGNALTGKIAGVQVIRSSNGPAGSSKIVLRGHSSLTGDNQPLIVVDGVPINNFTGRENNDYWNPSLDMGSGMADLNPEDIESVSVLKGASAAALYGSRAGNGVILITTKKGKQNPGLGINFSTSFGIESAFTHPEMQNSFGQGIEGIYDNQTNLSWGPEITGQEVENWNGQKVNLAAYDNVKNFFDNGTSQNYAVSFQQDYGKSQVYTSVTRSNDKSHIPGAELHKTNLTARATSKFGKKDNWNIDTKVQYINAEAKNRPLLGHNPNNPFYTLYLLPRSLDIRDFENAVNEQGKMIWYGSSSQINPYWAAKYIQNRDVRDRFILSGNLSNQITEWLKAEISAGSDIYTTNSENKRYAGSSIQPNGSFSMGKETFFEHNFSTLFTARKDNIIDRLGVAGTLGGNVMMQEYSSIRGSAGELQVPNLFALNNSTSHPTVSEGFYQKRITSVYGSAQMNWDGYFFLEGTLRNDWSSTLSPDNRSYLYPSVNTSLVFSDMIEKLNGTLPTWFSFGKFRASLAQVGNSLNPYELYNTFRIGTDPNGNTTATMGKILFDENVKNELITSKEVGLDLRFFQNRIGLDFTWYKSNATNQLINLPMDPLSGYNYRKINAGDIQNQGIEIMLSARIFDQPGDGFKWEAQFNYSHNKNTIKELAEGITFYQLGGFDNLQILAEAGGDYGVIYGTSFLRVKDPNSPDYGKLLLTADGLPQVDPERVVLGSQQPSALMGITNNFSFKGFNLGFQFDGRFGGKIFSQTNQAMQYAGTADVTAPNGQRPNMILDGVIDNGDGTYSANTKEITAQQYWQTVAGTGNLGIIEANIYDATNVRLRYITLSYDLPKKLLGKTPFQKIQIGATMNNVWLITSHLNGVDPEAVYATGTNALGFENAAPPTTRSFLFNLNVSF